MNLEALHAEINQCTVCRDRHGHEIQKPIQMDRGRGISKIMAIGIAPGRAAIDRAQSFAGNSFTKISGWFRDAGYPFTEEQLRNALYLTSLNKCAALPDDAQHRRFLFRHCQTFLWKQIELVQPSLILLLGQEVTTRLIEISRGNGPAALTVGTAWDSSQIFEETLLRPVNKDCRWLAMPHPSGLSRTMNDTNVRARVISSLAQELHAIHFAPTT